ncbi:MAG: Bug family tripartite tricarboxylate transporter substrate binding protein [Xanthobacteraceae bacterium]
MPSQLKMTATRVLVLFGLALAFAGVGEAAFAQDYPTRPITLVAPFPPGASVDALARVLRDPLTEILSQPIIVENRAGAGGSTGAGVVANAAPDGYTLLVTVNAPITMNAYMQKNMPFDPRRAFAPITLAAETSLLLAVHPAVPAANVAELIAYAKQGTSKLSYGSAGVGSGHHITGELLKQKTGIDMNHIPYRGGGPAIQDLVAGHIQISFGTPPSVLPQSSAGRVRLLAVAEDKRFAYLPQVPTIAETVPGVTLPATWLGLLAPAWTPKPIIDKLNRAMLVVLKQPDVIEKLKQQGLLVIGQGPEALENKIVDELAFFGRTIPALGIQPE